MTRIPDEYRWRADKQGQHVVAAYDVLLPLNEIMSPAVTTATASI